MGNYNKYQGKSARSIIAPGDSEVSIYGIHDRLTHAVKAPPGLHCPECLVYQFIRILHTQARSSFSVRRYNSDLPVYPEYEPTYVASRDVVIWDGAGVCVHRTWRIGFIWHGCFNSPYSLTVFQSPHPVVVLIAFS